MYENVKYEIVPCPWSPLHWRNARLWWQHTCIIPAVATLYSVLGEHSWRCSAAYNDTMYTVFVLSSCHCSGSWPCLPGAGPHIRLPPRPQSWPDTMSGHYNQAYDDGGEPGAQEIGRSAANLVLLLYQVWHFWTFEHRRTNEWANQRTIGLLQTAMETFSVYLYFSPQYPIFLPSSDPEAFIMIICQCRCLD